MYQKSSKIKNSKKKKNIKNLSAFKAYIKLEEYWIEPLIKDIKNIYDKEDVNRLNR